MASESRCELTGEERNQAILKTLQAHSLQAALFVIGGNIDSEAGKRLLRKWNETGHVIGNHTYSHRNYAASSMTTAAYEQDILKAECCCRSFPVSRNCSLPMLKEGGNGSQARWTAIVSQKAWLSYRSRDD